MLLSEPTWQLACCSSVMHCLVHHTRSGPQVLAGACMPSRRCFHETPSAQLLCSTAAGVTHLDVGSPAVVVGLETHPALKDLASAWYIAQHLLHVHILVPEHHTSP